ncbi:MAG: hypothetical protein CVU95_05540 [Firmicutes bacterium HGW-Firmicutes-2]|jgi:hypothetical protein|nr:MAG: hypothetical protein CVU95_05540 [Firmicutes bacterium HGW-Firmicutes-2]
MPIRPIDLQVAIPKMSEVSRISHLDQQKSGLLHDQGSLATDRGKHKEGQTVFALQKDAKAGTDADARKKGHNEYQNNRKKANKNSIKDPVQPPKSDHKIDIRI